MVMNAFDFSPLFRSTIGFDRMQRLVDSALNANEVNYSYPPYNIEAKGENAYRITMAVAGFSPDELDVTVKENGLTVSATTKQEEGEKTYLHRGIAGRSFERRFELADFIKVEGAKLENGLLHVDLVRQVPEEKKPRKVAIATDNQPQVIEQKAA
jgi:molecular chaperone IbpA